MSKYIPRDCFGRGINEPLSFSLELRVVPTSHFSPPKSSYQVDARHKETRAPVCQMRRPTYTWVPLSLLQSLLQCPSPGVRQTMCHTIKKWHDASSYQAPEYLPVQQGQKQEVAVKPQAEGWHCSESCAVMTGLLATPGSRCSSCTPELRSLGYQINELPRLWALFAGDVHRCVGSPTQLQWHVFRIWK